MACCPYKAVRCGVNESSGVDGAATAVPPRSPRLRVSPRFAASLHPQLATARVHRIPEIPR